MITKKLPKRKYLRIHEQQFREWIIEVMKQEKMRFANSFDVANEIERIYGGVATSHMHRIRSLRINVQDYLPKEELAKRMKR